jgi:hypothetical protein
MDDDEILGESIMDHHDDAQPATSNHPAASSSFNNVQVDDSPLRPSLGRNKECKSITIVSLATRYKLIFITALKLKLAMRRPINQLQEQGILPCKAIIITHLVAD